MTVHPSETEVRELREAMASQRFMNGFGIVALCDSWLALQRERERLKAALREIEKFPSQPFTSQVSLKALRRMQDIARAALTATGEDCDGSSDCKATIHIHGCFSERVAQ